MEEAACASGVASSGPLPGPGVGRGRSLGHHTPAFLPTLSLTPHPAHQRHLSPVSHSGPVTCPLSSPPPVRLPASKPFDRKRPGLCLQALWFRVSGRPGRKWGREWSWMTLPEAASQRGCSAAGNGTRGGGAEGCGRPSLGAGEAARRSGDWRGPCAEQKCRKGRRGRRLGGEGSLVGGGWSRVPGGPPAQCVRERGDASPVQVAELESRFGEGGRTAV